MSKKTLIRRKRHIQEGGTQAKKNAQEWKQNATFSYFTEVCRLAAPAKFAGICTDFAAVMSLRRQTDRRPGKETEIWKIYACWYAEEERACTFCGCGSATLCGSLSTKKQQIELQEAWQDTRVLWDQGEHTLVCHAKSQVQQPGVLHHGGGQKH